MIIVKTKIIINQGIFFEWNSPLNSREEKIATGTIHNVLTNLMIVAIFKASSP